MATTYHCIQCSEVVTKRMHAVCCDSCNQWQHRKCKKGGSSGITAEQYRQMVQNTLTLDWICVPCRERQSAMDVGLPAIDEPPASPIRQVMDQTYVNADDEMEIPAPASPLPAEDTPSSSTHQLNTTYIINTDDTPGADRPSFLEDRSFDISGREFQHASPLDESLPDRCLDDFIPEDGPVTYEIVTGGTKRGGHKLVSSDGFTYTRREMKGERTYWTCSIRNKKMKCGASVKQFGDLFTPGILGHLHPAEPGILKKVKIAAKVKEIARRDVFRPAGAIVEDVMKELTTSSDVLLPKPDLLARAANLHRQSTRPKDPISLEFEIDRSFIGDDFIVDDVRVGEERHIICATEDQLQLLRQAKRWFVDGTFKLVKRPFYQLMSVHAFVRKDDDAKQVPLAYILMSRRSKEDYVEDGIGESTQEQGDPTWAFTC